MLNFDPLTNLSFDAPSFFSEGIRRATHRRRNDKKRSNPRHIDHLRGFGKRHRSHTSHEDISNISSKLGDHNMRAVHRRKKPKKVHARPAEQRSDTIKRYATFADIAYKETVDDKLARMNELLGDEASSWEIDKKLSDQYVSVFTNGNDVVTAVRGTDITDINDLTSDFFVIQNSVEQSNRFHHAERSLGQIMRKYDPEKYNIILSGHSLGGSINRALFDKYSEDIAHVYNFNPGSSTGSFLKNFNIFRPHDTKKKITSVYIRGDPISTLGQTDRTIDNIVLDPLPDTSNPHSITQFLP